MFLPFSFLSFTGSESIPLLSSGVFWTDSPMEKSSLLPAPPSPDAPPTFDQAMGIDPPKDPFAIRGPMSYTVARAMSATFFDRGREWRMHEEAEAAVLAALREEEMRPMIIEEPKEDENKQVEQPRRGRAEILRKLLCGLLTRTRSEQ
ncbi:hypothetical protein PRIPAC_80726 [Pristionchus pacificus]|uniref:Uncharacterized protein n=1 Tax=Pristionchus pacificus TaxID=54126 RepID=A0A2A6C2N6_PRIPA|nr:hypothetical protein PRIPAC_80726 [Pristionchus pacificus]|eukprot:PDM72369.1 hypothetical protein PRIPAC_38803 [Pristionchus pacificus]